MNRLKYIYNKVSAGVFLYWYAVIALLLPNIALCFTEGWSSWACGANVLLPLAAYMLFLSIAKRPGKMIWWSFILVFFAAFQLVLLYLFGTGVIAVDMFLNLVTTNPGEAMELLDNLVPAVVGVFVVYLPLLILGVVNICRKESSQASSGKGEVGAQQSSSGKREDGSSLSSSSDCPVLELKKSFQTSVRRWAMNVGAVGLLSLLACYVAVSRYSMLDQLYPVNVCYNLYLAFERNAASGDYQQASRSFRFDAQSEHPADAPEIYVMVVGETARAHDFSLYGYERDTNPLLSKTAGITAFTDAMTQSNTTHKSVPMLLSAASAEDFERLFHEKGILAAFREAGFHTVFISNQLPNHSFIDFLGEQADEHYFLKEENTPEASSQGKTKGSSQNILKDASRNHYDADLLAKLDEILPQADASSGKHYRYKQLFIVLHTYGSHFNYQERYPRSFAYFKPDQKSEAKPENRTDLLNAYDNTIRYTDYVLHGIIERLQKWETSQGGLSSTQRLSTAHGAKAAMLYTSDHGENIFDDSRNLFLHASPKASDYELHVPLIVWTSQSYGKAYPQVESALQQNRTKQVQTSLSAFHTMLNLGGIKTRYRQDNHSVASSKYQPTKLLYLNDHDEAIPQDEAKY